MSAWSGWLWLADPNTRTVLAGSAALGLGAGVVGSLAVLRRRALLGDGVAHAALPGIAVAFLAIGDRSLPVFMVGALTMGLLAVGMIAAVRAWTRVKEDAAIGIALSAFFGLGLVLMSWIQRRPGGSRAGLDRFLFGQAATMVWADVVVIGAVVAVTVGIVAALMKEFGALCFDREFSASAGRPVAWLDFVLMALVCVCTVAGLPAAGVVLMAALLIIPAVTARLWVTRLGPMLVVAGMIGAGSGAVGTILSAELPGAHGMSTGSGGGGGGWPTGPMITLVAAGLFGVSVLASPRRGVVSAMVRAWGLRRRLAGRGLHGPLDPHTGAAADAAGGER